MNSNVLPAGGADYSDARILRAAASVGVLGGAGQAAPRILAALSNPLVSSREVAGLVAQEPGLSVRVLRIANSAFYGQSRSISTVDAAIRLLGLDAVRGVAAAACMDRTLAHAQKHSPLDLARLVEHSLGTAIAARDIARLKRPAEAGDAFIAGLLQNLGVTVQVQVDPEGVRRMLAAREAGDREEMLALEAGRVGVGHQHCLKVVFGAWNLPASLVAACCHHHDPEEAPVEHRQLASAVHLGGWVALRAGLVHALEPEAGQPSAAALGLLGLDPPAIEPLQGQVMEQYQGLKEALKS